MITDIIYEFGWNYIILLVSNNEYGRAARLEFLKRISKLTLKPICIVMDGIISTHDQNATLKIISNLNSINKSNVIVFIASIKEARYFIKLCAGRLRNFTWVASEAWVKDTMVASGNETLLHGMLGISPLETEVPGFVEHLARAVALRNDSSHQWLNEFYNFERLFLCNNSEVADCILADSYEIAPYQISSTVNAVYAVAHALHVHLGCNENRCQRNISDIEAEDFLIDLEKIKFTLNDQIISFDSEGDVSIQYQLWNYKKKRNRTFGFEAVGIWRSKNSSRLNLFGDVVWNTIDAQKPFSNCSDVCKKGK